MEEKKIIASELCLAYTYHKFNNNFYEVKSKFKNHQFQLHQAVTTAIKNNNYTIEATSNLAYRTYDKACAHARSELPTKNKLKTVENKKIIKIKILNIFTKQFFISIPSIIANIAFLCVVIFSYNKFYINPDAASKGFLAGFMKYLGIPVISILCLVWLIMNVILVFQIVFKYKEATKDQLAKVTILANEIQCLEQILSCNVEDFVKNKYYYNYIEFNEADIHDYIIEPDITGQYLELKEKFTSLEANFTTQESIIREIIQNECVVVPPFYLSDEEYVERMLFLLINKRADTIKELINLADETKWREDMLDALHRIGDNIWQLRNELNNYFSILIARIDENFTQLSQGINYLSQSMEERNKLIKNVSDRIISAEEKRFIKINEAIKNLSGIIDSIK